MTHRRSIRFRLNLLFGAASLVALAVGVYGVSTLRETRHSLETSRLRQDRLNEAHRVQSLLLEGAREVGAFVAGDEASGDRARQINAEAEAALERLEEAAQDQAERKVAHELLQAVSGYQRTLERVVFALKKERLDYAKGVLPRLDTLLPEVDRQVDRLVRRQHESSLEAERRARARTGTIVWVVGLSIFGLVLLGVLLLIVLQHWLVRPLEALATGARRIAHGDYGAPIPDSGTRELSELSRELSGMGRSIANYQREMVDRERLAALGEMTYAVAHNVRNPLASIRALAQSSLPDALSDQVRESLRQIIRSVDRLDRWLKDLLVSLRPIKLSRQTEDLNDVVREVAESMETYATQRGVSIEIDLCELPCRASIDRRRLDQALISVVSNAIEASPRGERIRMSSAPLNGNHESFEIVVEDRGVGISSENRTKIFTPYFTTKSGGTGLG
ncbi:MAG: HAMP domain-containing protein, partial [Planctomycetes bacterium]|nr:HAMP domain-containing protein [Planctomycetota bacterium]